MKKPKYFLIFSILINIIFSQSNYRHYNYDEIMKIFQELSQTCSHYIRIDTSQMRYNLDTVDGCGKNKKCKNLIVFMTDFDSYTLDRPVYYISGILHGDEVIGPSSVTEFAKYFCDSYNLKKNSLYHNILKNKLIIMTPMTNAYGYYNSRREEKVYVPSSNSYKYVDPNRDFPYYNSKDKIKKCMETLAGRTINEIFNEFIISGAITFHGGTSVLGYAWGNFVHAKKENSKLISTEPPDYTAFNSIGELMVKLSSSKNNRKKKIRDYILGDMTTEVYPLDGALEDWAYGGWENHLYEKTGIDLRPIKTCKPSTFCPYEITWKNIQDYDYKLRCLMYLAEASDDKTPNLDKYGINNFNTDENGDIFDFYKTTNFFGHIPRNMRLIYSGIDLISSSIYMDVEHIEIIKKKNQKIKIKIPFLFMGCFSLKKYSVHKIPFERLTKEQLDKKYLELNTNESNLISELNDINCYYDKLKYYNLEIEIEREKNKANLRNLENNNNKDPMHYFERPGGNYDYLGNALGVKYVNNSLRYVPKKGNIYIIKGEGPDKNWSTQKNPDPNVEPQSHVVRSKTYSNYFVKNGNHTLKSNYYIYSYPVVVYENGEIQIVDEVDSLFYKEHFTSLKLIINSNDENYNIDSQLFLYKKKISPNEDNNYLSSENIYKINLEIHIFQENGDYLNKILKENKQIKLFSQLLLNDENENYHLKELNCEYHGKNMLFISCQKILGGEIKGRDIRQKLVNSLLGFELKVEKQTFLTFFGQITLDDDYKGKYYVDFYSKENSNYNNKMICTSNFPYFINIYNYTEENDISDNIFYIMNISKISTTKLKVIIDIKQYGKNKYNYFIILFPFSEKIEFFDIKEKIFSTEINLDENANGKIVGKTVYVIPIENEDYKKSSNFDFKANNIMSLEESLNKISKNKNYKLIPCSIMSYNSILNENSISELRKMIQKFPDMKPFINKRRDFEGRFIYKHFFISTIFLSLFLILIFYLLIRKYRKKSKYYRQFDEVAIASTPQLSRSNIIKE